MPGGINFSVYSNHATAMTLVLFRRGEPQPLAELPFPPSFRIGGVFAMTVFGLDLEACEYGYRQTARTARAMVTGFDPGRILIDPYARLIGGAERGACGDEPAALPVPGAASPATTSTGKTTSRPACRAATWSSTSCTCAASPGTPRPGFAPGTYAGLTEKIGYLRELGVNCVELMPVFEYDELDNPRSDPATGRRLCNYWGYNPLGFFAPKAAYAATGRYGLQVDEFKNMVKKLHHAGIEIVLDVVFNHTAEGDERGPVICFRGLDNATYYMLTTGGRYCNFSGTGNTLNCNHPVVRGFVLDCLRYWAAQFHIDGFRFDLAAILGRAPDGTVLANPPLLESLAHDPLLRDCKLIAEAWDAGGLYQVGSFPGYGRWSEQNGRYRDAVRRFLKGDLGTVAELATRLTGSADLYGRRGPAATVNFVTAHDGFTLRDLVSYNHKHNQANGEGNRDGDNANLSWNCGHEGPAGDPQIRALRDRQARNALLILLSSQGIPVLQAGDEAGRTQHGNNNAYCHDGPLTWFDWDLVRQNADLLRFARLAIAFRQAHPVLRHGTPARSDQPDGALPAISWHGVQAWKPDWEPHSRLLAVMRYADHGATHDCVYLAANSHWEAHSLELPALPEGLAWHLFADTAAPPPREIHEPGREPPLQDQTEVRIGPRSVLVLTGRPPRQRPPTGPDGTRGSEQR